MPIWTIGFSQPTNNGDCWRYPRAGSWWLDDCLLLATRRLRVWFGWTATEGESYPRLHPAADVPRHHERWGSVRNRPAHPSADQYGEQPHRGEQVQREKEADSSTEVRHTDWTLGLGAKRRQQELAVLDQQHTTSAVSAWRPPRTPVHSGDVDDTAQQTEPLLVKGRGFGVRPERNTVVWLGVCDGA